MKLTRPPSFLSLLLLFAWTTGDLKASPEIAPGIESTECSSAPTDLLLPDMENPCYAPDWNYTCNITETCATWQWGSVYGCNGYYVQWRYPNGSWNNLGGICYQNYCNVTNLNPSCNYEWRVRTYCGYNNYSNWCSPVPFCTLGSYCNYPDWTSCYNIGGYSATWKWASCYGADYYWIQWRYPGGAWCDLYDCPVYGTWVNVNHLQPCTNYEWRVKSHCNSGWSNWCNSYGFTTSCNICPAPYGCFAKDIYDNQCTLKWSPVNGAHSYTVQMCDNYGTWHDLPGCPVNGTWINAYNLQSCHSYQWRVRANCGSYGSYGYWCPSQYFTTTCGSGCNAPQWVYTSGISNTSATLHWQPVNGADYYVAEWRSPGGTWYPLPGGTLTNPWAEITGLQASTAYEWRVKSHCHDGKTSGWSSTTSFSTLGESCGLPFFRYTLPVTDSSATFNWSVVAGALNYSVQYRLLNGTWADVTGSPTTASSITVKDLLPDTVYEWQMKVNCSNGASTKWLAAVNFHTGNNSGCNRPASLAVDSLTLTSARLNWSIVQGAETYSVELRVSPNGAWKPVPGSPVTTNFIRVDSLKPHTAYEWHVRANCAGGLHGFYSDAQQFTTTDLPPCSSPRGLSSDSITEAAATLHWSSVASVQGYKIQIRFPNGAWMDVGGLVSDTSFAINGLTAHTTYEWHVNSKCNDNQVSYWSATAAFTTSGGAGVGNNECAGALLLTVGDSCVSTFASNVDATASQPSPVGGCPSNGNKDVWFKFKMPDVANPSVTVRTSAGSLADVVMEVYTGTECNLRSIITCEDNNDNGNGSLMPVVNLTGTPNTLIWVRAWGRDGVTGTFTICVFSYVSFNYAGVPVAEDPDAGELFDNIEEVAAAPIDIDDVPQLSITPNPVSDNINVVVRQAEDSRVIGLRILDYSGKVMITQDIEPVPGIQFKSSMDVSTLAPGMYVVQVQTTSGVQSEKITVVR